MKSQASPSPQIPIVCGSPSYLLLRSSVSLVLPGTLYDVMLAKMSGVLSGSDNRGELECGQLAAACLSLRLHIEFPNSN